MSSLAEGLKIVARMSAVRDDGGVVPIAFIGLEGEPLDDAEAFEVAEGGRLTALGWRFAEWRKLFESFAPERGKGG